MVKSKLKQLLEYCPRPPKPLTTTLKRYSIPTTIAISVSIVLTSIFLLFPGVQTQPMSPQAIPIPELPTVESNYYPGVSVGDYVTYGNFVCNISPPAGPEWDWMPDLSDMDWQKVEVIGLSGKEVILRYTEQFKNGSATGHSGCVHVIEDIEHPGWINGTCQFQDYYFGSIISANLTAGDCIHSEPHPMPFCNIAKTEIRTYLGANRWVNIINSTNEPHQVIWVYDVLSGMLLEYEERIPDNQRIEYSIIETNIFSPSTQPATTSTLEEATVQETQPEEQETTPQETQPEEQETTILADFEIRIGKGDLGSPEDVVLRLYGDPPIDYLLKEDRPHWEPDWLPPPEKGRNQSVGSWGISLRQETPFGQDYCGTYNIANKLGGPGYEQVALLDTMAAHGISSDLESHQFSLQHIKPKQDRVGDYWGLSIGWKVGDPGSLWLKGNTNEDAEWEGAYYQNTDTWTITFDSAWFKLELPISDENTPFGESITTTLWEGQLSFTIEIKRILND